MEINLNKKEKRFGLLFLILGLQLVLPLAIALFLGFYMAFTSELKPVTVAAILNFTVYLIAFSIIAWFYRGFLIEEWNKFKKNIFDNLLLGTIYGQAIIILTSGILNIIIVYLFGDTTSSNQETIEILANQYFWMSIIPTVLFAPLVEEVLYRGVISSFFKSTKVQWIVSSICFGAAHTITAIMGGSMVEIALTIPYIAMGAVFFYVYKKTDSLITAIILHTTNNLIAMLGIIFLSTVIF